MKLNLDNSNAIHAWNRFDLNVLGREDYYRNHFSLTNDRQSFLEEEFDIFTSSLFLYFQKINIFFFFHLLAFYVIALKCRISNHALIRLITKLINAQIVLEKTH